MKQQQQLLRRRNPLLSFSFHFAFYSSGKKKSALLLAQNPSQNKPKPCNVVLSKINNDEERALLFASILRHLFAKHTQQCHNDHHEHTQEIECESSDLP